MHDDVCVECFRKYNTYHTVDMHNVMLKYMDRIPTREVHHCAVCGEYTEGHHRHEALHRDKLDRNTDVKVELTPKTQGPPTERQLLRVRELKNHELFNDESTGGPNSDYDWLLGMINAGMLNSMGGCGKLIAEMKKRINNKGGNV